MMVASERLSVSSRGCRRWEQVTFGSQYRQDRVGKGSHYMLEHTLKHQEIGAKSSSLRLGPCHVTRSSREELEAQGCMSDRVRVRSPANHIALHRLMTPQNAYTTSKQYAHMFWFGISNGVTAAKEMA